VKERDELISREAYAREEYETAKQAMQDWEVVAMEERSQRENLGEKVSELEDQVVSIKEAYERAALDRDSQTQTVEGLQRALRDIQDGKKVNTF
jgi:multidrug resistance efflux pump